MSEMIALRGGDLVMGSDEFYSDEGPVHRRRVDAFAIECTPVTNRAFASFVEQTGYVTVAEQPLSAGEFPGLDPVDRMPGSTVFTPTSGPVDLGDWRAWWTWVPGADWRHPFGLGSDIGDRLDHPVVHVAYEDATEYAAWAGMRLPTEAEFEYAARGGLEGARYAWGDDADETEPLANHWQGRFPYDNTGARGWIGTSPVGAFPPNGYGIHDLIGNVWEWTTDLYTPRHIVPGTALGPQPDERRTLLAEPQSSGVARRVLKGGSHLCSPDYCLRYRPAARSPQTDDSATTHIGFRCVTTLPES